MDTLEFVAHRVSFAGLPGGELRGILRAVRSGEPWPDACLRSARKLRGLALNLQRADWPGAAAGLWQRAACAYHAASFGLHFEPEKYGRLGRILRLRQLARLAHRRALRADAALGRQVAIPLGGAAIGGYMRAPLRAGSPVVVLLNGLDSICEVEMHAFSTWLVRRGLAVLALDLPAAYLSRPRSPRFAAEEVATRVADWVGAQPHFAGSPLGAFGVSFGGHLVARLMAGDARFRAGVSVSPPAWLGARELRSKRMRVMFACCFDLHSERGIEETAGRIRLDSIPPAAGRLLLFRMTRDQLFGREHADAFRDWGRGRVEVRHLDAEHVGTSQARRWLPAACGWLRRNLR